MAGFRLSAKAKADLTRIAKHTQAQWGLDQRNRYVQQLDGAFHWLAKQPDVGKDCSAIRPGYRKFPQGSHLVFYRPSTDGGIEIIRILHKNMDVQNRLRQ